MKLKSKLIATIVSICAAIAVMGVGVWAATSNFTVSVTNNVNIGITNLAGTITYSASATGTGIKTNTDDNQLPALTAKNNVEIFNSATSSTYIKEITSTDFAGVDLFTMYNADSHTGYITNETSLATLTYTFVYEPLKDGDQNYIESAGTNKVTITTNDIPDVIKGADFTITYQITVGSTADEAVTITSENFETDVVKNGIATNQKITVTMTAVYSNTNLVSASIKDADGAATWDFDVLFENVA